MTKKEKDTLNKMYFYMQDHALEIKTCVNMLYMVENYIHNEHHKKDIDKQELAMISRIILHTLIINIFKLCELIKTKQRFLMEVPEFNKLANEFKKKFLTEELIFYRNKYIAHHSDKKQEDDFLNYQQLTGTFCKIINIDHNDFYKESFQYVFKYILKYGENFSSKNEKPSEIVHIIFNSENEFKEKLGLEKLDRNYEFS